MPLTAAQLIDPEGEILPALFPDDDDRAALETRLDVYLQDGYSRAGAAGDDAARFWAYYRAYNAVYLRLAAALREMTDGDYKEKFSDRQPGEFQKLAEKNLSLFREEFAASSAISSPPPPSMSTTSELQFLW